MARTDDALAAHGVPSTQDHRRDDTRDDNTQEEPQEEPQEETVRQRILAYLRRHPSAKDTLQGIAVFWVDSDPELVGRALARLVADEQVEEVGHLGTAYYQRRSR